MLILEKVENLFWSTLYSGITKQLLNIFFLLSWVYLILCPNKYYFQLPVASKQLAVH